MKDRKILNLASSMIRKTNIDPKPKVFQNLHLGRISCGERRESILPSGYISRTHSPGARDPLLSDCWMLEIT